MYKQNTDESRVVRLTQIQHFLHKNKAGLTSKELAELCNTTVRTIQRDLLVLQCDLHIPLTNKGHDRYGIMNEYVLPPVSYSLYEALGLFLAARLIIRQTDDNNPHIKSALVKLTSTMPKSLGINLRKSIANFGKRLVDLEELDVFEKVAIAWVTQKRVKIIYQSLSRDQDKEWLVNPYFIEMTGVGYSTYLIGYGESADRNGVTTFKLNRIKEVTILDEDFEIPEDFNIEKLLGSSWGVMWGETIEVKLKFAQNVTRRVKESTWHHTQQIKGLPNGGCILTMQVGSTLEMTPWIRGWGPDVEVLEPVELREQFKEWAKELSVMYQPKIDPRKGDNMDTFDLLKLWAKKSDDEKDHYPLICHMLDAAAVTNQIWQNCLHQSAKHFIASELQLSDDEQEAGEWLSFFVGLHDFGKATPDFQGESENTKIELDKLGFIFNRKPETYHGTATACLLADFLKDSIPGDLSKKVSVAIGGHHGTFPRSDELQDARRFLGKGQWNTIRADLYKQMVENYKMQNRILPNSSPGNAFFMFLAGLTSVADWIASNEQFFPINTHGSVNAHLEYATNQAAAALETLHWTGWSPAQTEAIFTELFKDDNGKSFVPRPLQKEVIDLAEIISNQPGLVIIEAPMGEGKTEAAIYLADSWVTNCKQRGYYFALPTMATSDQMFGRVKTYLTKRYPENSVNLMLLHGHASLSDEFEAIKDKFEIQNIQSDDKGFSTYDGVTAGVVASEWFTSRKRGLLSPFGVGTIDQSLLAVLQTRHVFVRLFGLAHKTIIIDEVHAYDAYMSTLLERLLEWLAALGSSVVLLSATLPKTKRATLLQYYQKGLTGKDMLISQEVSETKYPRISWANDCEFHAKTIGPSLDTTRELNIRMVNGDLPENDGEYLLGQQLKEALKYGGCGAVICNTVDHAQKVYQLLKPYFPVKDAGDGSPELDLLHARYLYGDRQEREKRTIKRFGKDRSQRPQRTVLVATQIIEQSLDIDFDLMVTEMAPVDLLLQRSGRMHRHKVDSMNAPVIRPDKLKTPTLWICEPKIIEGVPFFGGGTEAVYDYHILLRSWLALSEFVDKKPVKIPDDVEGLIEKVYGEKMACPDIETAAIMWG